ncbi:MAG: glycoside hydrolase, partial [Verrucomicrobiae bacterium]
MTNAFRIPDGSKKTYVPNPWVARNAFRAGASSGDRPPAPDREVALGLLPEPFWSGGDREIAAYRGVWEFALRNIRPATAENGFAADYADTAFNNFTFLWDSAFITMFWRYGRAAWDAMGTLDNFYAKQHPDGFISRQISGVDGTDHFPRHDPSSTGPNVLAWAEWEWFRHTGDAERLARVFPALAGYTRWMRRNRTWPDGSYWATGWASGMDDQPRRADAFLESPPTRGDGFHVNFDHGHMAWVEACFQALLANRLLVGMAGALGIGADADEFREEAENLASWCAANLWDERTGFFHDRTRDGCLANHIKSVGAYWALLAGGVDAGRLPRFVAHLA